MNWFRKMLIYKTKLYNLVITATLSLFLLGCSDDTFYNSPGKDVIEEGREVNVSINPLGFSITSSQTRAGEEIPVEASPDEMKIENIWIFQFDKTTEKRLVAPQYITISNQDELKNLKVILKEVAGSVICVVANTYNNSWGTNISTLTEINNKSIDSPAPYRLINGKIMKESNERSLPMSGIYEPTDWNSSININVKRMYAKIKIYIEKMMEGMELKSINIEKVPYHSQFLQLGNDADKKAVPFPDDTHFYANATFMPSDIANETEAEVNNKTYVMYVPETIQGESESIDANEKTEKAPAEALKINLTITYTDDNGSNDITYSVYPGGNTINNYNIQRNCVYHVKVRINSINNEMHTPSANCFVIKPGQTYGFEPYYRTETGGGYKFTDYLDADDETGKKVIESVKIIWQTKDAIGDNTDGSLVYLSEDKKKIYVKAGSEGNALIGAYNKDGVVLWSWHIWVTGIEPDNLANAITYYTYKWDNTKIYSKVEYDNAVKAGLTPQPRIPGRPVMKCNLGALAFEPADNSQTSASKTFGMQYQWGRKDPFPPMIKTGDNSFNNREYNDELTGPHYDNSNIITVEKTSSYDPAKLFHTIIGDNENVKKNSLLYSVMNPTVFICGTKEVCSGAYNSLDGYFNNGDWIAEINQSDDGLWGGKKPVKDGSMKYFIIPKTNYYIFDNYGEKKTIYDPCPKGWRVPPGDIWLGFTSTGVNPGNFNEINTKTTKPHTWGLYMYMGKEWRNDDNGTTLSFFPTQGPRIGNGQSYRVGTCGNYHNATTSLNGRVNILHVHDHGTYFMLFETSHVYSRKSVAGPIRCVRDTE